MEPLTGGIGRADCAKLLPCSAPGMRTAVLRGLLSSVQRKNGCQLVVLLDERSPYGACPEFCVRGIVRRQGACMPTSKTKIKNAATAAKMAALPLIPKELID